MKTICYTLVIMILISITGIKIHAQEKVKPWSIGNYLKPVPPPKTILNVGLPSVQTTGNISTNNIVYLTLRRQGAIL